MTADPDNVTVTRIAQSFVDTVTTGDAAFAEVEAENPGFLVDLREAVRPAISAYFERLRIERRPIFIADMHEIMSAEEVYEILAFFEGSMGQTLLRVSRENIQLATPTEQSSSGGGISEADLAHSNSASLEATIEAVSPRDLEALGQYMSQNPRLQRNVQRVGEWMQASQLSMRTSQMTDLERDEVVNRIRVALRRYGLMYADQ